MLNNKKKGFTLVELLVVIAILAILAAVSVVGYLGFTNEATKSNVLVEMTEYKTTALAKLADGKEEITFGGKDVYTFAYDGKKLTVSFKDDAGTTSALNDALAKLLNAPKDKLTSEVKDITDGKTETISTITYKGEKASATWTIAGNKVEAKID